MQAITNVTSVKQGVTFEIPCRITNEQQQGENLLGFTVQAVLREKNGDRQRVNFTVDQERLAFGEFTLILPASVTATLGLGFYEWDIILTNAQGEVDRFPREKNFTLKMIEAI